MSGGFILSPYRVTVDDYGYGIYHARSRGKALSAAYHSSAFEGWSFKQFLQKVSCWKEPGSAPANYGRIVEVGGEVHRHPGMYRTLPVKEALCST